HQERDHDTPQFAVHSIELQSSSLRRHGPSGQLMQQPKIVRRTAPGHPDPLHGPPALIPTAITLRFQWLTNNIAARGPAAATTAPAVGLADVSMRAIGLRVGDEAM